MEGTYPVVEAVSRVRESRRAPGSSRVARFAAAAMRDGSRVPVVAGAHDASCVRPAAPRRATSLGGEAAGACGCVTGPTHFNIRSTRRRGGSDASGAPGIDAAARDGPDERGGMSASLPVRALLASGACGTGDLALPAGPARR